MWAPALSTDVRHSGRKDEDGFHRGGRWGLILLSGFQAGKSRETEAGLRDGCTHDLDPIQVARTDTGFFGNAKRTLAVLKRRFAAIRHRIESHQRRGDGIGTHAVQSR